MQKIMACMLGLLMLYAQAQAATYVYERDGEVYLTVENLSGDLPQRTEDVFSGLLAPGDEILSGTIYWEPDRPDEPIGRGMMAVRRDGQILLMGAYRTGTDTWDTAIETDTFFADGQNFSIYTQMKGSRTADAQLLMACDDGTLELWVQEGGAISAYRFADHSGQVLEYQEGQVYHREGDQAGGSVRAVIPNRLAAWTYDSFPKTLEEAQAFAAAHPLVLADDEGFIHGVNLRERATDQSLTWGKYTARARILGSRPGRLASWVHVQIGGMMGWVSGMYLETTDDPEIYGSASRMQRAGCVLRSTVLVDEAGEHLQMTLEEGTLVHVLGGRDGWLHVIVPRNEMNWMTDWDGTYGLVRDEDLTTGISPTDAKWKAK